jgi:hypothetical protein
MSNSGSLIAVVVLCVTFCALVLVWILFVICYRRCWFYGRKSTETEHICSSALAAGEPSSSGPGCGVTSSSTARHWTKLLGNLLASHGNQASAPSIPFEVPLGGGAVTPARRLSKLYLAQPTADLTPTAVGLAQVGDVSLALTADSLVLSSDVTTPAAAGGLSGTPRRTIRRASVDSLASCGGKEGGVASSSESLIGGINPTLYKTNMGAGGGGCYDDDDLVGDSQLGGVRFGIQYQMDTEKLTVTLVRVRNLPSRHPGTANACDPFVRICLLPDTRCSQSKFRKRTCNPKFNESFVFQVSNKNLPERVLKLTVYDVDRLRRHNVIGHALFALKGRERDMIDEPMFVTLELQADVPDLLAAVEPGGEVNIGLCYNDHVQRITVAVVEARNLKTLVESFSSDFYVKVSLMRQNTIVKSKRTDIVRRDLQPKFNESFAFKLSADSIDLSSVVVTVWHSVAAQKDKCVGRVVLGSFMFARGKELEHWNSMVVTPREQVTQWHLLV